MTITNRQAILIPSCCLCMLCITQCDDAVGSMQRGLRVLLLPGQLPLVKSSNVLIIEHL